MDRMQIIGEDFSEDYETCSNCGGEGVIYMCLSEYACIDPESGCDLCERRCDWCRPAGGRKPDRAPAGQAAPPEGQPPPGGDTAREAKP